MSKVAKKIQIRFIYFRVVFFSMSANGKSIDVVRAFEEQNVQERTNVECFFKYTKVIKKVELKSMGGLFFLLFNFALLPAFCQYNVELNLR